MWISRVARIASRLSSVRSSCQISRAAWLTLLLASENASASRRLVVLLAWDRGGFYDFMACMLLHTSHHADSVEADVLRQIDQADEDSARRKVLRHSTQRAEPFTNYPTVWFR